MQQRPLARKDRESTHEPESLTEASLGLWRVNVTSASRIHATTPRFTPILCLEKSEPLH
ncbi:MAG: hypothetical protein VB124_04945 [Burkholderia sp.]